MFGGWAETRVGIAAVRTLARLGAWADRSHADLRLDWDLAPEGEWPVDDVLFVLRAYNAGGKPVTIERMGVLSLDRLLRLREERPRRRVAQSSWTCPVPPEVTRLERGGPRSEVRFSIADLAQGGFSLRRDMLTAIATTSDGRLWFSRVRDHVLLEHPRVELAEQRGQAAPGATRFRGMVILSPKGRANAQRELERAVREANRELRGERAD